MRSSSSGKLCLLSYHSCHIYRTWRARLDEMDKKWSREMFIFHAIIPALYHFCENFIVYVKVPLYSVCLNVNHEKIK